MTEAAQVFNQIVGERSKQKNSAYHKKNGSAVAKLGNKRMSWQEINSKHGKEETYPSTDGFMDYASFEKLPSDLKIEFINKLMDKYDIGLQHISRHLFNKGDDGLKANLRNNFDILDKIDYKKARANSGLLKFRDDVEEWKLREKAAKAADEAEAQRKRDIIWNAEFVTYKEFKELPVDGQVAYLNNMIKKYNVSATSISKCLFQITQPTLRTYLEKLNVYDQIASSKVGNSKTGKDRVAAFEKAIEKWRKKYVVEEKKAEDTKPEPEPVVEEVEELETNVLVPSIISGAFGDSIAEEPVEPDYITIEKGEEAFEQWVEEMNVNKVQNPVQIVEAKVEPEINKYNMVFTSNFKSVGLDSDWLKGLELMFKDKPIEICITVRTI